jgi:hypothetical protein
VVTEIFAANSTTSASATSGEDGNYSSALQLCANQLPDQPLQTDVLDSSSCGVIWQETLRALLLQRRENGRINLHAPGEAISVSYGMMSARQKILGECEQAIEFERRAARASAGV